ncbi:MAG: hypothetical protein V4439_04445 [Patescibacteria group bacterium]
MKAIKNLLFLLFLVITFQASSQVYVEGYYRKNGTYVAPHYRSSPNSTKNDNYSTKGNYNPYTGKPGTKNGDYYTPSYSNSSNNSSYSNWSSYTVDDYYLKVDLPYGSLDNNGHQISFIYKKVESPKVGTYEASLSDADGDLYEIKGTNYYVKFRGYFGYAGYGSEGVLEISSAYLSVFYKKP